MRVHTDLEYVFFFAVVGSKVCGLYSANECTVAARFMHRAFSARETRSRYHFATVEEECE